MRTSLHIIISTLGEILTILIIADSLLSFVVSPLNPVRETLGRILGPLYAPIRKVLPPMGGLDFSPIVLLILVQVLVGLLTSVI